MWLFPIRPDTPFDIGRGQTTATGAEGFAEMIRHDGGDNNWELGTNFKNVRVGDDLVIYAAKTPSSPPLLIGFGTIVTEPPEKTRKAEPRIEIRWNTSVCRRLGKKPMDATWLAKQLPVTKAGGTTIPRPLWAKIRKVLSLRRTSMKSREASRLDVLDAVTEASSDPRVHEEVLRRARRHQSAFRKALMKAYEGRCAVTGTNVAVVLEAAHISPHAESGDNRSQNGLLLRADLHVLFDLNLLRINPRSLCVDLAPSLRSAPYAELHGRRIRTRRDGKQPGRKELAARWQVRPVRA
jgi:hypothetical protein